MKQFRLICITAFLALLCSCHNLDPFASKGGSDNTIGFYCNGEKYIQLYQTLPFGSAHKSVYAWREDNDILILSYVWTEAYPHWGGIIEALGFRIPGQRQYEKGDVILLFGSQLMVICKRTQSENNYDWYDSLSPDSESLSPSSQLQYLFPVDARITMLRHENNVLSCEFEITGSTEEQEGGKTVRLTNGVFNVTISDFRNSDIPSVSEDYHILQERYCDYIGQYYDTPSNGND